jgi:tRNA(fMet)-specific endonuclease VapC
MAKVAEFFVDTSILIAHIRKTHPAILKHASLLYGTLIVSDVVVFELEVGARRANRALEFATHFPMIKTYSVTQDIWLLSAQIQAELIRQNQIIGLSDTLIVATAIYHEKPLLTLNKKHFQRVPQVQLLDIPPKRD